MENVFVKKEGIDYIQNYFRFSLFDKTKKIYLLTVDDGNYIFINSSVFKQIKRGKIIDKNSYDNLLSKGILITPNNIGKIIKQTKTKYSFLENGTSLHIVIPTYRCNQGCSYCFASPKEIDDLENGNDLDDKTSKKIIEFIMSSPGKAATIEFTGGEAMANYPQIQVMTTHAKKLNNKLPENKKKNLKLAIVTNLTMVNEEMINWLIDNDVSICTSLDGPEHVHDENRYIQLKTGKQIGTHKTVVKWIERINEIYKERGLNEQVNSLPTITKYSLPYYKEIIDEHFKYNLNTIDIRPLTYVGKANEDEKVLYSHNEFKQFYLNCLDYLKEIEIKTGNKMTERLKSLYETKIIKNLPGYHTDFESPCGATTGQLTYHSDGKIYTCHEGLGREEFVVGDVFKDTWKNLFEKPQTQKAILNSMIEQNVKCDRCVFKPYCGTCMVENFYHFDKFNFYPTKTQHHHTTIMQSTDIFGKIYKKLKID
jgi:radical SAM protein with 4Fe4S-binding SPASM domain